MADINDIHLMLGKMSGKLDGLVDDVAEVKSDIKENIKPVISGYGRDRSFILGICATISAFFGILFGGLGKAIAKAINGG